MQALSLDVIDEFLERQEAQLLSQYMEEERTPLPTVLFVSALSQMWIFALYEFLRTWRERAENILRWRREFRSTPVHEQASRLESKKRQVLARSGDPKGAEVLHWPFYESAVKDLSFAESLEKAVDRTERRWRGRWRGLGGAGGQACQRMRPTAGECGTRPRARGALGAGASAPPTSAGGAAPPAAATNRPSLRSRSRAPFLRAGEALAKGCSAAILCAGDGSRGAPHSPRPPPDPSRPGS
jgi:hypothetical protein